MGHTSTRGVRGRRVREETSTREKIFDAMTRARASVATRASKEERSRMDSSVTPRARGRVGTTASLKSVVGLATRAR